MTDGTTTLKFDWELPGRTVHVWSAVLDLEDDGVRPFAALLDAAESTRASRFHFERDRRRFTVARGMLRTLVGAYLEVPPREVEFGYSGRGKPYAVRAGSDASARLCFNVSHSGGRALLAFARGAELGVDLEAGERLGDDWPALARRIFSRREQAELAAVPAAQRRSAFLNGWTRKEAFLKATAQGIVDGLTSIEVTLDPSRPPALVAAPGAIDIRDWQLHDLRTDDRFSAALIIQGAAAVIERREYR